MEDYNKAVEYFDDRGGTHFNNKPNRRNIDVIRKTQSAEDKKRSLDEIKPEMQQQRGEQPPVIEEEIDGFVDEDYVSETTHTRALGSTSLKRKSDTEEKIAKKMTTYPPGV
eukprot:5193244-Amphidinium_carterae.1